MRLRLNVVLGYTDAVLLVILCYVWAFRLLGLYACVTGFGLGVGAFVLAVAVEIGVPMVGFACEVWICY